VSSDYPKNGIKALFQTEKMVTFNIDHQDFELAKHSIGDEGIIKTDVLLVGVLDRTVSYQDLFEKVGEVGENFVPMVKSFYRMYVEKLVDGFYDEPIWSKG
jgi:hypothetical protein